MSIKLNMLLLMRKPQNINQILNYGTVWLGQGGYNGGIYTSKQCRPNVGMSDSKLHDNLSFLSLNLSTFVLKSFPTLKMVTFCNF